MVTTDPIADMLTRIRNASSQKHKSVDVPASKEKLAIAQILFEEGYILLQIIFELLQAFLLKQEHQQIYVFDC